MRHEIAAIGALLLFGVAVTGPAALAGSGGKWTQVPPGLRAVQPMGPGLFTFRVNIKLAKIHKSVDKAFVYCVVSGGAAKLAGEAGDPNIPPLATGVAMSQIPLHNGAYSGPPITVKITKMKQGDSSAVNQWGCALAFEIGGKLGLAGTPWPGLNPVFTLAKQGTNPKPQVTGGFAGQ